MSRILGQLAIVTGIAFALVAFVAGMALGVPVLVAAFRAAVVMCVGTVVVSVFFRLFTSTLYRFIAEQALLARQRRVGNGAKRSANGTEAAGNGR